MSKSDKTDGSPLQGLWTRKGALLRKYIIIDCSSGAVSLRWSPGPGSLHLDALSWGVGRLAGGGTGLGLALGLGIGVQILRVVAGLLVVWLVLLQVEGGQVGFLAPVAVVDDLLQHRAVAAAAQRQTRSGAEQEVQRPFIPFQSGTLP